jgi:hypothetical protein
MKWTNREGKEIPLSNLDDNYLLGLLNRFHRHAVLVKETMASTYHSAEGFYFHRKGQLLDAKDWREFADEAFFDLEYEAARRKLNWQPKPITLDQQINMQPKGSLEARILGSLRRTVNAHGPITKDWLMSAMKRIVGDIRTYNHDLERQNK